MRFASIHAALLPQLVMLFVQKASPGIAAGQRTERRLSGWSLVR